VSEGGDIEEIHVLAGHKGKVNQLQFSPNGKYLASCCQQRDIIIWNLSDWSIFTKAWGSFHTANITCLSWNPNSEALATGGLDQYLFIWSLTKKTKRIKVDRAHQGGVTDVFWTSESVLSSVGQDNALKTWNVTLH
jgi:WD40 repeat protein